MGHCHGTLCRGVFDVHLDTEAAALAAGHPARVCEVSVRRRAGCDPRFTNDGLVLVESFPAVLRLVIAGGGELAELLVAQAHLLGWEATVAPAAQDAVRLLADRLDAACPIVLSHERDVDIPVLNTALTTGIADVGALGSRRTQARRAEALVEAGFDEAHIERIHGPINAWLVRPRVRRSPGTPRST